MTTVVHSLAMVTLVGSAFTPCACRRRSANDSVSPETTSSAGSSASTTAAKMPTHPTIVNAGEDAATLDAKASPWACTSNPSGGCPGNGRICLFGRIWGYAAESEGFPNDCWWEEECPGGTYISRDPHCSRVKCTKTLAAIAGTTCSAPNASCWYQDHGGPPSYDDTRETRCRCVGGKWSCAIADCPPNPPVLGSTCDDPWKRCRYSVRCGEGTNAEEYRVCRKGVWEEGVHSCAAE